MHKWERTETDVEINKINMRESMKFEREGDAELYEESIYNLINDKDINCIYDLVEGYDDSMEFPDMMVSLDSVIVDIGEHFSAEDYVRVLSRAIFKMKGKSEEHSELLVYILIEDEKYRESYVEGLSSLSDEEFNYHKDIITVLHEESLKGGGGDFVKSMKQIVRAVEDENSRRQW